MSVSAYFADGTNGVSARYHGRLRRNHLQVVTVDVRARSKIVSLSCALFPLPTSATFRAGDFSMQLSTESLLIILVVGLVAGWLAGVIVRGAGFGLVGNLIVGVVGAFIGSWLLPQLGIRLGDGIVSAIINATVGAVILLFVVGLVRGGPGRGLWRR